MISYLEVGVPREVLHQIVERACSKRHGGTTALAEKVMPMPGRAPDVARMTVWLNDTGQHVDSGKDLQGPVDCRATDTGSTRRLAQFSDKLLGGKGPGVAKNRIDNRGPRCRQAVTMLAQHTLDFWSGECQGLGLVNMVLVCFHAIYDTRPDGTLSHLGTRTSSASMAMIVGMGSIAPFVE